MKEQLDKIKSVFSAQNISVKTLSNESIHKTIEKDLVSTVQVSQNDSKKVVAPFFKKVLLFFYSHFIFGWLFIFLLSFLCTYPFLKQPKENVDRVYILMDESGPEVFINIPFKNRDTQFISLYSKRNVFDSQLILHSGEHILVNYHGTITQAKTRRETVDNLLRRLDIELIPEDMISINICGDFPVITINTRLSIHHEEVTYTDYSTKIFTNPLLEKGQRITIQEGVNGKIVDTYNDVYEMGQIVETTLLDRKDSSSVAEIIEVGTLVSEVDREDIIAEVHPFHNKNGGYLVFASGDTMTYSSVTTCNATAYYGGYSTATGHPVGVGVIAVDPKVFPYGTRMFIQTPSGSWVYGIGTAWDCGGAVKGKIIDLWFETYGECVKWGRRDVTCYILN